MALLWEITKTPFKPRTRTETFPPDLAFTGQSVLVTSATSGLGLESAVHYVNLGAEPVIVMARTVSRGGEAQKIIEERTGKTGIVQVQVLDMDTFNGVKKFVKLVKAGFKTIDTILLNAGVHCFTYEKSPDGWEFDLQISLFSNNLLALLLLPWRCAVKNPGQKQHLGIINNGHYLTTNILALGFPNQGGLKYFNSEKN